MTQPNNHHSQNNPVGRFMVAAGAVIELENTGKILILKRNHTEDWHGDSWEIPYGRMAQFESTQEGLIRELKEETGLDSVQVLKILTSWHIYRGPQKAENDLIGVTYYCRTANTDVQLSHEHTAFRWVSPEEALQMITVEGIRRDVQAYQQEQSAAQKLVGKSVIGVGVGALIYNSKKEILLTLRGQKAKNERGTWEIPGGAVEYGETLETGLVREIKEELGIEIKVLEMLHVCNHILPDEGQHWVSPTYICSIVKGQPKILEPEKCAAIGWFSQQEAEKLPLSKVTQADLQVLKAQSHESAK